MMAAIYMGFFMLLAVVLTAWDKHNARCGRWRVRESTLWLVAVLGGALGMYVTMRCIRHKTRHLSFMIGLPLVSSVQIAAITFFTFYG